MERVRNAPQFIYMGVLLPYRMSEDFIIKKARKGRWQLTKFRPKFDGKKSTSNLQFGKRQKDGTWVNSDIKYLFDDNLSSLRDLLNEWFDNSPKQGSL
jgi:hypothetical protein